MTTIANDTPTDKLNQVEGATDETAEAATERVETATTAVGAEFIDAEQLGADQAETAVAIGDSSLAALFNNTTGAAHDVATQDLPALAPPVLAAEAPIELTALPVEASNETVGAPAEPKKKKGKRGLIWGLVGAGAVLLGGAGAASMLLLAPNTTIAGVPVGLKLPGQAAADVQDRIQTVVLTVDTPTGSFEVTGADVGASIDTTAVAELAHQGSPLYNFEAWSGKSYSAPVTIDPIKLEQAALAAQPGSFVAPTDATLTFNAESNTYTLTPAIAGTGIDADAAAGAIEAALASGEAGAKFTAIAVEIAPHIPDTVATTTIDAINGVMANSGLYIGDENVSPVDAATISSLLTIAPNDAGTGFDVTANGAGLEPIVAGLSEKVNRSAQDGFQITDSGGNALEVQREAIDGRELGDVSNLASEFATKLESAINSGVAGPIKVDIPATVTPGVMTNEVRQIHVDLSQQRLYQMVNGEVYDTWLISSGTSATPTHTGDYRIEWKLTSQTMIGNETDSNGNPLYEPALLANGEPNPKAGEPIMYRTENVQFPMYHNTWASEALHGVYWHNNFGSTMSHGCIGMPDWRAEELYYWTPIGTEVSIYY